MEGFSSDPAERIAGPQIGAEPTSHRLVIEFGIAPAAEVVTAVGRVRRHLVANACGHGASRLACDDRIGLRYASFTGVCRRRPSRLFLEDEPKHLGFIKLDHQFPITPGAGRWIRHGATGPADEMSHLVTVKRNTIVE